MKNIYFCLLYVLPDINRRFKAEFKTINVIRKIIYKNDIVAPIYMYSIVMFDLHGRADMMDANLYFRNIIYEIELLRTHEKPLCWKMCASKLVANFKEPEFLIMGIAVTHTYTVHEICKRCTH